jgi:HSP20 family molecular chaperone IbpA
VRYQQLRYRYALVVQGGQPRPLGEMRPGERFGVTVAQPRWRPAADVYETARGFAVTVELAGVDQDELEVLLYEDAVVVQGRRRLPACEAGGLYHLAEIRQGPFRVEVPLPAAVDSERVEARYDQGLLRVTLPRAEGRR